MPRLGSSVSSLKRSQARRLPMALAINDWLFFPIYPFEHQCTGNTFVHEPRGVRQVLFCRRETLGNTPSTVFPYAWAGEALVRARFLPFLYFLPVVSLRAMCRTIVLILPDRPFTSVGRCINVITFLFHPRVGVASKVNSVRSDRGFYSVLAHAL